jgi:hypothetical protein
VVDYFILSHDDSARKSLSWLNIFSRLLLFVHTYMPMILFDGDFGSDDSLHWSNGERALLSSGIAMLAPVVYWHFLTFGIPSKDGYGIGRRLLIIITGILT